MSVYFLFKPWKPVTLWSQAVRFFFIIFFYLYCTLKIYDIPLGHKRLRHRFLLNSTCLCKSHRWHILSKLFLRCLIHSSFLSSPSVKCLIAGSGRPFKMSKILFSSDACIGVCVNGEFLLSCRDGVVRCEASLARGAGGLSGRVQKPAELCNEFPLSSHLCPQDSCSQQGTDTFHTHIFFDCWFEKLRDCVLLEGES